MASCHALLARSVKGRWAVFMIIKHGMHLTANPEQGKSSCLMRDLELRSG